jgi:DNA-binding Lrp family transcriptional regulator
VAYHLALLDYVKRCPGPHFRELSRELGMPVGTLQYWLGRLMELGMLYSLRLAWRPRYFHAAVPRNEAEVIYVIREVKLTPSRATELTTGLRPEVVQLVADKYPCVRRDLVDAFITLFSQL